MDKLLMHVGPSIGNRDVLLAGARSNIGFASREFVQAVADSLNGLRFVMGAGNEYQPFIIPGSGTSAMESVTTFLHEDDRVLILTNGVFGDRWEGIFSRYRLSCDIIRAEPGDSVTPAVVKEKTEGKHYRLAVMTQVETSTGVRAPIDDLIPILRNISDLVAVDGVAGVGGEKANAEKRGIDIFLTASQKAIGAPPGAGLLVVSPRAMSDMTETSLAGYSLNLMNWLPIMRGMEAGKGGYFATPPISTIFSLQEAFRLIEDEGLDRRVKRHSTMAQALRVGIEAMNLGVVAKEEYRSNTVTGLRLSQSRQSDVLSKALSLGVEFGSGVHKGVKPDYIRIGHMGWVEGHHIIRAVSVLERALKASGENIEIGQAVAAAQESLSRE